MERTTFNQDKIIHGLRFVQSVWTFGVLYHLNEIIDHGANKILFGVHFALYLLVIIGRFIYMDKKYIRIHRRLSVPLNTFMKFLPIIAFFFFVKLPGPVFNILVSGSLLTIDFLIRDYTSWFFTKEEIEEMEKKRKK